MILSDTAILEAIDAGQIIVAPFRPECLGSNSYDVHLSRHLAEYTSPELDCRQPNQIRRYVIPQEGLVLRPRRLYLASTLEYTETHGYVPYLEGKSSVGRLGICVHQTAGKGDAGFCGVWTLEITVTVPVRVYPGMPIGQLIYHTVEGLVANPYHKKQGAKYSQLGSPDPRPQPSRMFLNKF